MLDQLDDPMPFTPTPELITSAKARGRQLQRRRRARLAVIAVPALAVLAIVAGGVYVGHRADEVQRVSIAAGVLTPVAGSQPFNILVVGTDGPRGQADARTDTMLIVHVDEAANRVRVLSIPRDLAFTPSDEKLDAVLGQGGPQALIQQLEDHLGIPIAHFVAIDEPGLAALVDQAGGVQVQVAAPMRDLRTGLTLHAGCNTLDGDETVALVRSRYVEVDAGGAAGGWIADPSSDLGREARQQELIAIVGRKLATMPIDSSSFTTLLDVFADHTTLDSGFGRSELLDLATWAHGLSPDDLATETVPVQSLVRPDGADGFVPSAATPTEVRAFLDDGTLSPSTGSGLPPGAAGTEPITACS